MAIIVVGFFIYIYVSTTTRPAVLQFLLVEIQYLITREKLCGWRMVVLDQSRIVTVSVSVHSA